MGVKELAQAKGFPDTHASVVYRDDIARARLPRGRAACARAGAVIAGLTTAPEFGIPSYTDTPLHGVTRNPWNLERTPGGSSGGSAAAVAAGLFPACTGSDGGGSIRIPSSYSGLLGMKATFGRIGHGGMHDPFDTGLTSVRGPMVRSVRDAARYLDVDQRPDTHRPDVAAEARAVRADRRRRRPCARPAARRRVAWTSTLGYAETDPDVEAVDARGGRGARRRGRARARRPRRSTSRSRAARGVLLGARQHGGVAPTTDASEQLDELDLLAARLGRGDAAPPRRAPRRGDPPPPGDPRRVGRVFEEVDLLLTPTTPTTAFQAEGTLVGRGQRPGGRPDGPVGAVHRAVQHDGPARRLDPGRARRRDAVRAPGRRPPPRGRPRASRPARCSKPSGPGPSSPPATLTPSREPTSRGRSRPSEPGSAPAVTDVASRPGDPPGAQAARSRSRSRRPRRSPRSRPACCGCSCRSGCPGLGHVNMYGLVDDRGLTVVDPGLPGPSWKALKPRLKTAGLPVKDIHTVVVTHSHPDHFGGAGRIRRRPARELITHQAFTTWSLRRRAAAHAVRGRGRAARAGRRSTRPRTTTARRSTSSRRSTTTITPRSTRSPTETQRQSVPWGGDDAVGWQQAPEPPLSRRLMIRAMRLLFAPPEPTRRVRHGAPIRLAGRDWFAVHTPGHTLDHLCLYDPENGVLLSGDHVLPSITPHISGSGQGDALELVPRDARPRRRRSTACSSGSPRTAIRSPTCPAGSTRSRSTTTSAWRSCAPRRSRSGPAERGRRCRTRCSRSGTGA